ncbi:integral membrane protein 2C-like [Clupea harengus]|uniref:Integral membrane protein 2 n=1 Tax=Clupea harengus TaxID=7950 RepID=A0A6P8G2M0_CLUHA|nr:integral membrane protein 2C-like [Clupea harengus]
MVKISFHPVAGQKSDKEEADGEAPAVLISQPHEQVSPVMKRSFLATLSGPTFALLCFACSLLSCSLFYACVYIYTLYVIPRVPAQSEFGCSVMYDDAVMAPLRGTHSRARTHTHTHAHTHSHSLDEKVDIYLEDNYELISVPVPDFTNTHPAEIIHDFNKGLTAYHDITLDKCYVSELNSSVVMAPRNLWELLINVKRGSYLPQRYLVQEQMSVAARVADLRPLGPFISRLCSGKDTYRLRRHGNTRRLQKRGVESCHHIRHFENTFVMETLICEPQ